MSDIASLVGLWRLISFRIWVDGEPLDPKGANPYGYAIFTADGKAFIQLAQSQAASADSAPEELSRSYMAYAGLYRADPASGELVICVEASNMVSYIGTTQVRQYRIEGDRMVLGVPGQYEAIVVRVAAAFTSVA